MFPAWHLAASQEGGYCFIHQAVSLTETKSLLGLLSLHSLHKMFPGSEKCFMPSTLRALRGCDPSLMVSLLIQKQRSSLCVTLNENMSHRDTSEQGTCPSELHPHHWFILWWSIHQITPLLLRWNDSTRLNTAGNWSIKPTLGLLQRVWSEWKESLPTLIFQLSAADCWLQG